MTVFLARANTFDNGGSIQNKNHVKVNHYKLFSSHIQSTEMYWITKQFSVHRKHTTKNKTKNIKKYYNSNFIILVILNFEPKLRESPHWNYYLTKAENKTEKLRTFQMILYRIIQIMVSSKKILNKISFHVRSMVADRRYVPPNWIYQPAQFFSIMFDFFSLFIHDKD